MIHKSKVTILSPWTEIIGPFIRLEEQEGELLAEIANHIVVLPLELKDALTPHLGSNVSLLRTDIDSKEYLFRVLLERVPKLGQETVPIIARDNCRIKQMSSCNEAI
jgi:hypothetical protein